MRTCVQNLPSAEKYMQISECTVYMHKGYHLVSRSQTLSLYMRKDGGESGLAT